MRNFILGLSLLAASAVMGHAQATLPCDGAITRVRVSDIKPGQFPLFEKAVAANLAWYRGKGITTNNIVLSRIVERDSAGNNRYSQTHAMTIHYNPPSAAGVTPEEDDEWKAFVKMYNDSSTVKQTYDVCVPKSLAPQ
jgi:hypothetical protein